MMESHLEIFYPVLFLIKHMKVLFLSNLRHGFCLFMPIAGMESHLCLSEVSSFI